MHCVNNYAMKLCATFDGNFSMVNQKPSFDLHFGCQKKGIKFVRIYYSITS